MTIGLGIFLLAVLGAAIIVGDSWGRVQQRRRVLRSNRPTLPAPGQEEDR